ncbi:hypothetical protein [Shewanella algae]|uniref:hypothetical protein n=1 Tax=Shewanella algae TaxID=38313 RepID=UPI003007CBD0
MANPNPVLPTREQSAKGGSRGKRGLSKKTLARKLIAGLAESGSDEMTLQTVSEVLQGKHGSVLRLEIAKMVIEAGLNTNKELEIARVRADLKSRELVLSSILRQATKAEATAIYNKLEAAEQEQEEPDDDR